MTHDASPGERTPEGIAQAVELHHAVQQHGWEMVKDLQTWRLTEREAEALFIRLDWLARELPKIGQQEQRVG